MKMTRGDRKHTASARYRLFRWVVLQMLQRLDCLIVQVSFVDQLVLSAFEFEIGGHQRIHFVETRAAQDRGFQVELRELLSYELIFDALRKCEDDPLTDDLLHG